MTREEEARAIVSPVRAPEDAAYEGKLRPRTLDEFIGQEKVKERLSIFIEAARRRGEPLEHVLLTAPPGLGKTTLAHIIANEMGVPIVSTSGPVLERPADIAAILTNLEEGSVLFIDEIHRLPRVVEEVLYPAMEEFRLDLVIGKGPAARTIKLELPRFTLVGATTRSGLLTGPLRERFGIQHHLNFYEVEELEQIAKRSAKILGIPIDDEGAREIAARSRGTPRVCNRLLRRVRDYAEVRANGVITKEVAKEALEMLEVDELGLTEQDRRYLLTIIEKFGGGPVGVETLCAATHEERDTLEDVYEPFLLKAGLIERTPRGRVATRRAYEHLGVPFPGEQGKLF